MGHPAAAAAMMSPFGFMNMMPWMMHPNIAGTTFPLPGTVPTHPAAPPAAGAPLSSDPPNDTMANPLP